MTCRHMPYERDIVVVAGKHVDPCAATWNTDLDGTCPGCWPCDQAPADRHCGICCHHLDASELQTCTDCLGKTRRALLDVVDLATLLPDQALDAAHDGHLAAADPIPGGDALVMMSRGSEGLTDDDPENLLPPSYVLAWWEEELRDRLGLDSRRPAWQRRPAAALAHASRFLDHQLTWAAAHYPAFHALARDLRRTRHQLEDLLRAGTDPLTGVPCFLCSTTLQRASRDPKPCACGPRPRPPHVQSHADTSTCCLGCATLMRWELQHADCDQGGVTDTDPFAGWACPRCKRTYNPGEYQLAISVLHSAHAPALPATELAERIGVSPSTIYTWANRGHIARRGRAADGRMTYDVDDALRHAATPTSTTTSQTGETVSPDSHAQA